MKKDGVEVVSRAGQGEWIVCMPGERYQHFSETSEIVSIHLAIRSAGNGAEWRGVPILRVMPGALARRALKRLRVCRSVRGLASSQRLEVRGQALPLQQAIEMQELASGFFRHLLDLIVPAGMHYAPPPIEDVRVRQSYRFLSALDVSQHFSRHGLAAAQGLSAAQLDRLWREELGLTPRQYRDRIRHIYACDQLRQRGSTIKVVAADLGFRHLSQFSNWFCTRQGESPRRYRSRPAGS